MDDLGFSDGEDINDLTVNKDFAKSYDQYRRKEEIQKLKDKGVEDFLDDESSSDDEQELYASKIKEPFLNAIASVVLNDPVIFDKNHKFYPEPTTSEVKKEKKPKKQLLKDYERERLLAGHQDDSDDDFDEDKPQPKSYYQEQEEAKKQFSLQANKELEDDSDGELFTSSEVKNIKKEEEDEKEALVLKPYWTDDSKLSRDDIFLRDYFMQKQWRTDGDEINTSDEEKYDEDDVLMEQRETLDYDWNNRSEANQEVNRMIPRKIKESVRNFQSNKQKRRAEKRKRKEEQRVKRSEEVKRYKALVREEFEELIAKYQKKGLTDLTEEDACDFDPETYDKKQKERYEPLYNEDFTGVDIEKPVWSDDEEDEPNWDKWNGEDDYGNDDFAMDYDYEESAPVKKEDKKKQKKLMEQQELSKMMSKRRKRRKKSAFHEAIEAEKPIFNPKDFDFSEFLDKHYQMDCADMIGEDKIKFKYRQVQPQTYGLTTHEIFNSDTKALNSWVSMKKVVGHHGEAREKKIKELYEKKLAKKEFHFGKFTDMHKRQTEEAKEEVAGTSQVCKKKKKKKKVKTEAGTDEPKKKKVKTEPGTEEPKKKKKKKKVKTEGEEPVEKKKKKIKKEGEISKSRLAAYGM